MRTDFTKKNGKALPPNSTVTWKGTLTPPHAGDYWIYLQAMGTNARILLDGKPFAGTGASQGGVHGDILQANQDNVVPTTGWSGQCAPRGPTECGSACN